MRLRGSLATILRRGTAHELRREGRGFVHVEDGSPAAPGAWNYSTLRSGKLSIRGKGAGLYQLDAAPQATMALRLTLGSGVELCTTAPPDNPTDRNDTTDKFIGIHNITPASCPRFPP